MIIIVLTALALLTVLSFMVIMKAVGGTIFTVMLIKITVGALVIIGIVKFLNKRIQKWNES